MAASENRLAKRQRFLSAIARGASVTDAAHVAGIDRTLPYVWARENPNFKRDWDEIRATRLQALTDTAFDLAMAGDVALIRFLIVRYETQAPRPAPQPRQLDIKIDIIGDSDAAHRRPFLDLPSSGAH